MNISELLFEINQDTGDAHIDTSQQDTGDYLTAKDQPEMDAESYQDGSNTTVVFWDKEQIQDDTSNPKTPTESGKPFTYEGINRSPDRIEINPDTSNDAPAVRNRLSNARRFVETFKSVEDLRSNVLSELSFLESWCKNFNTRSRDSINILQSNVNSACSQHNASVAKLTSNAMQSQYPNVPTYTPPSIDVSSSPENRFKLLGKEFAKTRSLIDYAKENDICDNSVYARHAEDLFNSAKELCKNGIIVNSVVDLKTAANLAVSTIATPRDSYPPLKLRASRMSSKNTVSRIISSFGEHIKEAAISSAIPTEQIVAIIAVESNGNPKASSGSAWGLMQLQEATWNDVRNKHPNLKPYNFQDNWFIPEVNIQFGTAALQDKMSAIGVPTTNPNYAILAFTAYNAGQGTVKKAISNAILNASTDPTSDALKPENLKPAIKEYSLHSYYYTGKGWSKNNYLESIGKPKEGINDEVALEEAVDLKYVEIVRYPILVKAFIECQTHKEVN